MRSKLTSSRALTSRLRTCSCTSRALEHAKRSKGYRLYENNNRASSENEIEQASIWLPEFAVCWRSRGFRAVPTAGAICGKHCVRSRRETVGVAPRGGLQSNWKTL